MEVELLVVGKTNTAFLREGIEEYQKRLKHYLPFRITVLGDARNTRRMSEDTQKEVEGKAILDSVSAADMLVLLDERGREFTSMQFSQFMEKSMLSGRKRVVFAVGGPYGFSEGVYARADTKVSLSKMTFSHEMVRLFFVEQLYRAMTILRGEPYHHE